MTIGRRPRLAAMLVTSLGGALVAGVVALAPGSAAGETAVSGAAAGEAASLGWASTHLAAGLTPAGGLAAADGNVVAAVVTGQTPGLPRQQVRFSVDGGRTFGVARAVAGAPLGLAVQDGRAWIVSAAPDAQGRDVVVETWAVSGSTPLSTARAGLPSVVKEVALAVRGSTLVVAAGLAGGSVVTLTSDDAGATFADPVTAATGWATGVSVAAVDGRTVLAYGARPGGTYAVEVRTSDDEGVSWSAAKAVDADVTLSPSLAVGTRGVSLAVVRDRRVAVLSSPDGTAWGDAVSVVPAAPGESVAVVAAHGDAVYATSDGTRIFGTTDGSSWNELSSPAPLRVMFPTLAPDDFDDFVATDDGVGVLNGGVLVRGYRDQYAPSVRFTAAPPAITRMPNQVVRFTSSDADSPGAWVRHECAFGANDFRPCSNPHSIAEWYPHLSHSRQSLRVRATDAAGRVSPTVTARWILDQAPPYNVHADAARTVALTPRATFRWGADDPDAGVASYDLRWSSTSQTASRMSRAWRTRSGFTGRSLRLAVTRDKLTCLQVRARDRAGHVSAWSKTACAARPYDDRALTRSGSTNKVRNKRFVDGSATRIRPGGTVMLRRVERQSDVIVVYKRESGRRGFTIRRPGVPKASVDTAGRTTFAVVETVAQPRQRRAGAVRITGDGVLDGLVVLPRWAW